MSSALTDTVIGNGQDGSANDHNLELCLCVCVCRRSFNLRNEIQDAFFRGNQQICSVVFSLHVTKIEKLKKNNIN